LLLGSGREVAEIVVVIVSLDIIGRWFIQERIRRRRPIERRKTVIEHRLGLGGQNRLQSRLLHKVWLALAKLLLELLGRLLLFELLLVGNLVLEGGEAVLMLLDVAKDVLLGVGQLAALNELWNLQER
jgi:hypothetical protein